MLINSAIQLVLPVKGMKLFGDLRFYGNFGLMASVEHASTHFRQYMHSGCANFSQGKSRIGTFIGHTSTHALQEAFVHFNGFLFKPRKLNLFSTAMKAP